MMNFFQQYKAFLASIGKGMGIKGNAFVMQMVGIGVLVVGLLILYIFIRMVFRSMGCLMALVALMGILGYIFVSTGNIASQIGGGSSSMATPPAVRQMQMPSGIGNIKKEWDKAVSDLSKELKGAKGPGKMLR